MGRLSRLQIMKEQQAAAVRRAVTRACSRSCARDMASSPAEQPMPPKLKLICSSAKTGLSGRVVGRSAAACNAGNAQCLSAS